MPSNDVRTLVQAAVPTAAAGAVAAVVSGVVVGGKGALGAVVGTLLVLLFMGLGIVALQYVGKKMPHLFLGMALVVYTTQLLFLLGFLMLFRNTTLFDLQTFAITMIAAVLVWVVAQARAHMKSKTLYVDPAAEGDPGTPEAGAPREK
ncbi:hypothetical protein AB0903_04715 [Streptomyces sp. NPDC048389]|uniref:hypothetical protein n=1 Tax=Streptomyces sp. NPDC048389 TaxID=3154622 RepID=UPI00345531C6